MQEKIYDFVKKYSVTHFAVVDFCLQRWICKCSKWNEEDLNHFRLHSFGTCFRPFRLKEEKDVSWFFLVYYKQMQVETSRTAAQKINSIS